jgi:hypothetical protein
MPTSRSARRPAGESRPVSQGVSQQSSWTRPSWADIPATKRATISPATAIHAARTRVTEPPRRLVPVARSRSEAGGDDVDVRGRLTGDPPVWDPVVCPSELGEGSLTVLLSTRNATMSFHAPPYAHTPLRQTIKVCGHHEPPEEGQVSEKAARKKLAIPRVL